MKGRLLYISGTDGSGKTTLCQQYIKMLKKEGYDTRYVWMRFPHIFSLVILGYCRLRGFTTYRIMDGQKIGKWEFYRSPIVCSILPWVLLFDTAIGFVYKIYVPIIFGKIILCDRFVIDVLVDLMVSTNNFDIHRNLVGKLFMGLIPWGVSKILILDVEPDIISSRRKDLNYDDLIKVKVSAFRLISKEYSLVLINANNFITADWRLISDIL